MAIRTRAELDLEEIRAAETGLASLNLRLASEKRVPSELWEEFHRLANGLLSASQRAVDSVDPYLVIALQQGQVASLLAQEAKDPLTQRRELRIGIEQMRQALRDIVEGAPVREDRPAKEIAIWLNDILGVPQAALAEALGTSPRSLQRWLSAKDPTEPDGPDAQRLRMVARIANQLRHILTGPGVIGWLQRPNDGLGNQAPVQLIDDPNAFPKLEQLAIRARSGDAS
ncbi:MAG: hypothetical protein QOH92_182 [Chloroflexota bacterium]|jgi:uncharacterized protein (DUF2384 family)|nr:hypothetical protein [Chloroflexota bacterium]